MAKIGTKPRFWPRFFSHGGQDYHFLHIRLGHAHANHIVRKMVDLNIVCHWLFVSQNQFAAFYSVHYFLVHETQGFLKFVMGKEIPD